MSEKIGVLMLHGFTACPHQFDELAVFLQQKGYKVAVPAIAGHTGNPEDLRKATKEDWKNSVRKAYEELKQKVDKIFIVGNSFGSNLALWLAREFNNEQSGVVILAAPIFLKYHKYIVFRMNTYGLLKKYYKKPRRVYKSVVAFLASLFFPKNKDLSWAPLIKRDDGEVIPIRSLRNFLSFIKKDTKYNLHDVKVPVLIAHSNNDTVIEPKSAQYIYNNIGSEYKKLFWLESNRHVMLLDEKKIKVFKKIHSFIRQFS